jgi:hypothetical protein
MVNVGTLSCIRYGDNSEHNMFKRGGVLATNYGVYSGMKFILLGRAMQMDECT